MRQLPLLIVGLVAMFYFFGGKPKPLANATVSIKDMRFDPTTLEIKAGQTVIWTNNDDRDHTVAATDGWFQSENLKPGASYSQKFGTVGSVPYHCTYHPRMKGVISVVAN